MREMHPEIKFQAEHEGIIHNVETVIPKRPYHKGIYKNNGYVLRRVNNHPFANGRGYVAEHRLMMEKELGRFLDPKTEIIHHIDGNRSNNDLLNLKLTTPKEHFIEEHFKARNNNGQFVAEDPLFSEIKFRLFDRDKGITQIYKLNELISKTFRRAKFELRGRFTGLHDKNGKPIYEGDIVVNTGMWTLHSTRVLQYSRQSYGEGEMFVVHKNVTGIELRHRVDWNANKDKKFAPNGYNGKPYVDNHDAWNLQKTLLVLGNIHENPDLLEQTS